VLGVEGAVDILGHQRHLRIGDRLDGLDVHDGQDRVALHVGIAQRDALGIADRGGVLHQAHHRDREEQAVGGGMVSATLTASATFMKPVSGL
jgi:hypothetical protein